MQMDTLTQFHCILLATETPDIEPIIIPCYNVKPIYTIKDIYMFEYFILAILDADVDSFLVQRHSKLQEQTHTYSYDHICIKSHEPGEIYASVDRSETMLHAITNNSVYIPYIVIAHATGPHDLDPLRKIFVGMEVSLEGETVQITK